jgi:hypothetical protein
MHSVITVDKIGTNTHAYHFLYEFILSYSLEKISVDVMDSDGLSVSDYVTVFVKPANDPPFIAIGNLSLHDYEESEADQVQID